MLEGRADSVLAVFMMPRMRRNADFDRGRLSIPASDLFEVWDEERQSDLFVPQIGAGSVAVIGGISPDFEIAQGRSSYVALWCAGHDL